MAYSAVHLNVLVGLIEGIMAKCVKLEKTKKGRKSVMEVKR